MRKEAWKRYLKHPKRSSFRDRVATAVRAFEKIAAGRASGLRTSFIVNPVISDNEEFCDSCGAQIRKREEYYYVRKSAYAGGGPDSPTSELCYQCAAPFVDVNNPARCDMSRAWFDNGVGVS